MIKMVMKLVNLEKNDINLKINNACFITIFFLLFRTGYDTLKVGRILFNFSWL